MPPWLCGYSSAPVFTQNAQHTHAPTTFNTTHPQPKETIKSSASALGLLAFFAGVICLVFSSIIFYMEIGTYIVTEEYPEGAFLRPTTKGDTLETSPFASIPVAAYFVMVTATTVRTPTPLAFHAMYIRSPNILLQNPTHIHPARIRRHHPRHPRRTRHRRPPLLPGHHRDRPPLLHHRQGR